MTGLIQLRECQRSALDSTVDPVVTMKMQDTFANALAELCQVGYPQSPPELRQELIAEQSVRGQSDPELKKYLWVVIRTQKDKKLQTLIEVCTDFSSLMTPSHLHRPAEQTFAVHQEVETYAEGDGDSEDIFAVGDRPPWTNRRPPEPSTTPTLQQMFALARRMGCEMRPIDRQTDAPDHLKEIDRSQIRIVDSALTHGPVGTIPESSASAVDSLDTCRPAAHDRTCPYHSSLWVGNSNLIIVNNGMSITNRETPHGPGPHPHRSTHTSFEPHVIIIHRIELILLTARHCDQLYSSVTGTQLVPMGHSRSVHMYLHGRAQPISARARVIGIHIDIGGSMDLSVLCATTRVSVCNSVSMRKDHFRGAPDLC